MKKNLVKALTTWITAAVILTVGILCCAANGGDGDAYEGISLVMGITFIILGSLSILANTIVSRRVATASGISAGVLLATGIWFVSSRATAGALIALICDYVPYIMVVLGFILVVDAVVILIISLIKKLKGVIVLFAVEVLVGAAAIVLGAFGMGTDNGIADNKFLIFGIIVIIYAAVLILQGVFEFLGKSEAKEETVIISATVAEVNNEAPAEEAKAEEAPAEEEKKENE